MPKKPAPPAVSLSAAEHYKELSTRQVAEYIGATTTKTVWVYVKEGRLPKPRYLRPHKPIWRLGEVLEHTHARMKGFDEEPRGFKGDEALQTESSSAAEKLRQRLFGRKA